METTVSLTINGQTTVIATDAERPLLDVLREDLGLTGAKYSCGEGQCGACTVLVDGRPVRSCITTIAAVDGKSIKTIEGLADGDSLHAVQEAFLEESAMQCGYCTSGMIMTAVSLLERTDSLSRSSIVDGMNGHICRCNGYPKIVNAIQQAAKKMQE